MCCEAAWAGKAPHASARPSHEFRQNFKRLKNPNYVTGPIKNCPAIEPILTRSNVSYTYVAFLAITVFGPRSCTRLIPTACLLAIAYPADYDERMNHLGCKQNAESKLLDVICCGGSNQK